MALPNRYLFSRFSCELFLTWRQDEMHVKYSPYGSLIISSLFAGLRYRWGPWQLFRFDRQVEFTQGIIFDT